jgi:hypothetical protein
LIQIIHSYAFFGALLPLFCNADQNGLPNYVFRVQPFEKFIDNSNVGSSFDFANTIVLNFRSDVDESLFRSNSMA